MRKFGITGYVEQGTDIVRASVAQTSDGDIILIREDGTDSPLPTIGGRWRTSGDVVSSAARTGEAFCMSALPATLPAHTSAKRKGRKAFKTTRTLRDHAIHMIHDAARVDALIAGLMVSYEAVAIDESIAA